MQVSGAAPLHCSSSGSTSTTELCEIDQKTLSFKLAGTVRLRCITQVVVCANDKCLQVDHGYNAASLQFS
jgi:hypothetical protein